MTERKNLRTNQLLTNCLQTNWRELEALKATKNHFAFRVLRFPRHSVDSVQKPNRTSDFKWILKDLGKRCNTENVHLLFNHCLRSTDHLSQSPLISSRSRFVFHRTILITEPKCHLQNVHASLHALNRNFHPALPTGKWIVTC